MRCLKFILAIAALLICASQAVAYEEEDAVPLTISAEADDGNIGNVFIKLSGKTVDIRTEISNQKTSQQLLGFEAHTPFFHQLGIAEENYDKTFSDLAVSLNAHPLKLTTYRRAFFLGEDVTKKLIEAGIDPIPGKTKDHKKIQYRGLPLEDWLGYVSYSWITALQPKSTNMLAIRYRALPQFGLDDTSSERFGRMIAAHCGNATDIRNSLAKISPTFKYVYFERYEIPIPFVRSHKVSLEVTQTPLKHGEVQPIASFVCGIGKRTGDVLNFSAEIENPQTAISVLVLSKFPGSIIKESQ
jgi:hypothetical protein